MINMVGQDRVRDTDKLGYTPVKTPHMRQHISHNWVG
jgi:hypothetical protein